MYKTIIKTHSLFNLDDVKEIEYGDQVIPYERKPNYVKLYKVRKVIKEEHAENIAIRQKKIDKKI